MTGLFFGSFNPIHNGHLIIAESMRQQAKLEQVWFIVSPQNPLKDQNALLDEKERLKMVKLAIKGNPFFTASDIEFQLPKPSYTINTLTALKNKFPAKEFALIMGSDNLDIFSQWKDYLQILNNYPLHIYRRDLVDEMKWKKYPSVIFWDTPQIKVSSTQIRKMLLQQQSIRYLVSENVRKYIIEKRHYHK